MGSSHPRHPRRAVLTRGPGGARPAGRAHGPGRPPHPRGADGAARPVHSPLSILTPQARWARRPRWPRGSWVSGRPLRPRHTGGARRPHCAGDSVHSLDARRPHRTVGTHRALGPRRAGDGAAGGTGGARRAGVSLHTVEARGSVPPRPPLRPRRALHPRPPPLPHRPGRAHRALRPLRARRPLRTRQPVPPRRPGGPLGSNHARLAGHPLQPGAPLGPPWAGDHGGVLDAAERAPDGAVALGQALVLGLQVLDALPLLPGEALQLPALLALALLGALQLPGQLVHLVLHGGLGGLLRRRHSRRPAAPTHHGARCRCGRDGGGSRDAVEGHGGGRGGHPPAGDLVERLHARLRGGGRQRRHLSKVLGGSWV
mmetsp:Transcript_5669/g.13109  ORF Transcript_5669/g.13109 Transcript_5669/m.13109 type:complete len:371 (+) Transcript_5669:227-1339(+)